MLQKRDILVQVKLSESEHETLATLADSLGTSKAAAIRYLIINIEQINSTFVNKPISPEQRKKNRTETRDRIYKLQAQSYVDSERYFEELANQKAKLENTNIEQTSSNESNKG